MPGNCKTSDRWDNAKLSSSEGPSIKYLENRKRIGVDMVKPWNSVRIKFDLDLWGPDIRPDFDNRHLIIEGHRGLRRW